MKKISFILAVLLPLSLYAAHLQNLKPLTSTDACYIAPRFGPDGQLFASVPKFAAIVRLDLKSGAALTLVEGRSAGYEFLPSRNGNIFYKIAADGRRELWLFRADGSSRLLLQAAEINLPAAWSGGVAVRTADGNYCWDARGDINAVSWDSWVYQEAGGIYHIKDGRPQRLSPEGVEAFLPKLSPDESRLVFETLGAGLQLHNLQTGALVNLGEGNNVCWSPDGTFLLFDRTRDDGHQLIAGDIIMVNTNGTNQVNLTADSDLIAQHPTISPDGRNVAFEAQGRIWIAELILNP